MTSFLYPSDIKATQQVTVPAGDYFLGDISYALKNWTEQQYGPLLEQQEAVNEYAAGDNRKCVIYSTQYGDGIYLDNEGDSYFVDGGNIGIIPVEAVEEDECFEYGCVIGYDEPFTVFASPSHDFLVFGDVMIYTGKDKSILTHWGEDFCDDGEADEYLDAVAATA